jgi:hypothetical protein
VTRLVSIHRPTPAGDYYRIAEQRGRMVVAEYTDDSISASDRRKVRPGYARTSGLIRPRPMITPRPRFNPPPADDSGDPAEHAASELGEEPEHFARNEPDDRLMVCRPAASHGEPYFQ